MNSIDKSLPRTLKAFLVFLFLGSSAGSVCYSHGKRVEAQVAVTEKFRLKIGEEKKLKSGVKVKIADTEFESKQLNLPGVSAPATSRFTIVLEVSFNGLSEKLYFVPKSPGTVSMEQNQFQNLTITYVGHSYDPKQVLTVEFSAR